MPEYWVEENIKPLSHQDSDRLLIENLEPIVDALKQKKVASWHFLREGDNWRGSQNISHIRLRFRATDLQHLKKIKKFLKNELDFLQSNGLILDHYIGKNGTPVRRYRDYYDGENVAFNEQPPNPKGWNLVQRYLEIGSEMAILLTKGRMNRIHLSLDYNFSKISHLFPNQCRHYYYVLRNLPHYPLVMIAYDAINPSP